MTMELFLSALCDSYRVLRRQIFFQFILLCQIVLHRVVVFCFFRGTNRISGMAAQLHQYYGRVVRKVHCSVKIYLAFVEYYPVFGTYESNLGKSFMLKEQLKKIKNKSRLQSYMISECIFCLLIFSSVFVSFHRLPPALLRPLLL